MSPIYPCGIRRRGLREDDSDAICKPKITFRDEKSAIQIPVDTIFIFIRVHFVYTDNIMEICDMEILKIISYGKSQQSC